MINIFEEISWIKFQQLDHITKLPLNEQVKYYNEYLYDLNASRQSWVDSQPKGPLSTSSPVLSYPTFSSRTIIKVVTAYYDMGGPVIPWERGVLTQTEINDIINVTSTKNARYESWVLRSGPITSLADITVGSLVTYKGVNSGASPDFNFVTNRNVPQSGTNDGPSNNNDPLPWVSGTREYIIRINYTNFEIVDIIPFIVP